MGITGLLPFLEKASRQANISEFSGCTVAIDSYCWLHKGAFACADKLVRGEKTDIHIKYCLKYVTMLLSYNIKPILVFDGRHLPAKAMTEAKRRESRNTSKKRAAELLSLGQIEEARSFMRRSVDITHSMALALIKECRARNVDCIVAPYEADSQLAYLNIQNIAHLVITEDSDLILFGCTKVLFKLGLAGAGTLVEAARLPLATRCPAPRYSFAKFRRMCVLAGCDYLRSLPGVGLAKACQFVNATQDDNFANALKKLPSFLNKPNLVVDATYIASFLRAEATLRHQFVYCPRARTMRRLTEPDDPEVEETLCGNAGELLDPDTAFQLALGNLDPFTLKKMDDWNPDHRHSDTKKTIKTNGWNEKTPTHPSIWDPSFEQYIGEPRPWLKKAHTSAPAVATATRAGKVVHRVSKHVPETQDQSLTIESLSSMYGVQKQSQLEITCNDQQLNSQAEVPKRERAITEDEILKEMTLQKEKSPILENKERSFRKRNTSYSVMKRLSKFPRTELNGDIVESKFFNSNSDDKKAILIENSPKKTRNPFASKSPESSIDSGIDSLNSRLDTQSVEMIDEITSQKENSPVKSPISPRNRNPFKVRSLSDLMDYSASQDSVIENTCASELAVTPAVSQVSGSCLPRRAPPAKPPAAFKKNGRLAADQPTLLSKFGFVKKPVMKR